MFDNQVINFSLDGGANWDSVEVLAEPHTVNELDGISYISYGGDMLIVYSGTDCPKCETLKNKLKQKGITFKEINVREDAKALNFLRSKGHRGIPQIYRESGDELVYVGFDI